MNLHLPECYRLQVQGIEIDCYLGVYAHEQAQRRPIRIDVDLYVPIHDDAAEGDDLAGTVNYEQVVDAVERIVGSRRFKLIESLCSTLADDLAGLAGVRALRVEITKPHPMPRAASVSVELWRLP
ncbi:MAG: dihydroneopterin aldolase [Pseudomonadota bacterium]|jgi:dihydroneopterin aldolase